MDPKAKAKRHVCPTCGSVTGSPNSEPKLDRSCLNLGLLWTLMTGGPLLWRADHPRMVDKEYLWMADHLMTDCSPRVTHSIGVDWIETEAGG